MEAFEKWCKENGYNIKVDAWSSEYARGICIGRKEGFHAGYKQALEEVLKLAVEEDNGFRKGASIIFVSDVQEKLEAL